jgi:Mn2+/Fe2+ NRAMP family transporter
MFGTIIAVFDGYSRALQRTVELLFTKKEQETRTKFRSFYVLFLFVIMAGSLIVVLQFAGNLREIVDFATVLSFMIAPVIAIFNFRLVTGKFLDKDVQPSIWLKVLSFVGILFLTGFAVYFLLTRF